MGDKTKMERNLELFLYIIEEINKTTLEIHKINEGISEIKIHNFEKKHKITIPFFYRKLLTFFNGGELFCTPIGTKLAQLPHTGSKRNENQVYLDDNFNYNKRSIYIPKNFFVIGRTNYGDEICIDLLQENVIRWSDGTKAVEEEWVSLVEWLDDEIRTGKKIINF